MKLLVKVLLFFLLLLLSVNLIYGNRYELYQWGMSKMAVKRIEGTNTIDELKDENALCYFREKFSRECLLSFFFEKNSLIVISYMFKEKEMDYFLEKLTEKYGKYKVQKGEDFYAWVDENNNYIILRDLKNTSLIIIQPDASKFIK